MTFAGSQIQVARGFGIVIPIVVGNDVGHKAGHLAEHFQVGIVDASRHLQVGAGVQLGTKLLCQFTWCGVLYDQLFVVLSVCKRHSEQSAYGK